MISTHCWLSPGKELVYHSLDKTGQVLFVNACKITTNIQTKGNNCEGTKSGRRADAVKKL